MAAGAETTRYAILLDGADQIRLEFDRAENTLSVRNSAGRIICEKLLTEYRHEALHCIRLEYDSGLTVYIDGLLRMKANVPIGGCAVSYEADGDLFVGSAAVAEAEKGRLHYPVPCYAPGSREICFDITAGGNYQFLTLECGHCGAEICVDGGVLLPELVDVENKLAYYRCDLLPGSHTLQTSLAAAKTVAIAPDYGSGCEPVSVQNFGPYDKIRGAKKESSVDISAELTVADCREGWQAGVIIRADHLADGGEDDDKQLGTNFFVGYRVCISENRLQLWKHRYDETLLREIPYDGGRHAALRVTAMGNEISLWMHDEVILEYRDRSPILCGYTGFHTRNCVITNGTIVPIRQTAQ